MKTKIMLMIVVAFKSQNQLCWNLRIFDGGKLVIICVSGGKITCLLVMVIMVMVILMIMVMMAFIMMAVI